MSDLSDFDGLLDWPRLQEWVATQPSLPGNGPVTSVEQLTGGSQNNIFLLTRDGGGRMVLRRPPRHLRKNSNDTMLREARVLGAIAGSDVPHPEMYAACDDTDVIGVCFYVMGAIDGFTPMGAMPGKYGTEVDWRRALAFELVDGAAKLGAVDANAVGLSDFGKSENWLERQVSRWRSQLDGYSQMEGYGDSQLPNVGRVGDWLEANRPADCHIGIIHGDYQFANVMVAHDAPKLAAIVDWELSTLGDPLLDLAWLMTAWIEPGDPPGKAPQLEPWEGMPTRAELVARYGEVSGRDVSAMPWFFVLACYKLGILLEGTHARACAGQAPKEMGDMLHTYALWLFETANQSL
ncbi:MAG TPA: phosphotransferase family protein [Acidimicrobiia bacterium]|jgi:aminoglycoside phosphotransferase (APT) family kinase protein|nr:phosphotransferase family protein [Acidimicrobiia bacterium]